jgi:hypothetical protein
MHAIFVTNRAPSALAMYWCRPPPFGLPICSILDSRMMRSGSSWRRWSDALRIASAVIPGALSTPG